MTRHTDKIEITEGQLNDRERTVLACLRSVRVGIGIAEIGARSFPELIDADSYLRAKNALRRLVAGGLVQKEGRGTYRAAEVETPHPCAHSACRKPVTGKRRYCGPSCRGRASEARTAAATP